MRLPRVVLIVGLASTGLLTAGCGAGWQPDSGASSEVSSILGPRDDTPGRMTLLDTLSEELFIAREHAQFAAVRPEDVKWMHVHLRHMRHALDPTAEPHGPGLGYGVLRAANRLGERIDALAGQRHAHPRLRAHGPMVRSSAENLAGWANEILILSANALAERRLSPRLTQWVEVINQRLTVMAIGTDADGDQTVEGVRREGGLAQVREHLARAFVR